MLVRNQSGARIAFRILDIGTTYDLAEVVDRKPAAFVVALEHTDVGDGVGLSASPSCAQKNRQQCFREPACHETPPDLV